MSKRRYNFGLKYLQKLPLRYSYVHGWWVTDGYTCWLLDQGTEA